MKRLVMVIAIAILGLEYANAQGIRTYTSNEEDSMACVTNVSLYSEFFKQKNYSDARIGWRQAAVVCPKFTESLWQNGVIMYEELAKVETDEAKKEGLIDTMFWAYDQRIEHFGKEGYVLGLKGADWMKYKKDDPKGAFDILSKAYELEGNNSGAGAILYLYKSVYDQYRKKQVEKSAMFDWYSKTADVIDYNMKNETNANVLKAWESVQANVDKMFGTVAECPDLVEIYTPQFEAGKDDIDLLKRIIKIFEKRDCTDEDLYLSVAAQLYEKEPSAEAAYAIANGYAKKKNYGTAAEFYAKTYETSEDNDLKLKAYEKGAQVALAQGQYSKAKSLALKMLSINSNSGEAYMIIGDAYVAGKNDCKGNECTNRAPFMAAVDKYARAKAVDPSYAEAAQKKINAYSGQFPKKEDCFFHGMKEGDSYTLDCWIGETVTLRFRD